MNQPKIVSEKTVLKTKLFDVKKLELAYPKGSKRTHYVAERVPIVSVFPLNEEGEIYLVSQYRYLLKKVMLEAVAGHVEENETALLAAKRELKEETGISAIQWEELAKVEMGASAFRSKVNIFLAKGLEMGEQKPEENEEISVIKMPLSDAFKKVISGEINHSVTMIGIFLLDKLKREKGI